VGLVASAVGTDLDRIGTLFDTPRRLTDAVNNITNRTPSTETKSNWRRSVLCGEGADTCSDKSA
jgi:hypothetical protein